MSADSSASTRFTTRPLAEVMTSISSGKTANRDRNGRNTLYGSTGPIGMTNRTEFTGPSILVARVGANAGSVYTVDGAYAVTDNTLVIRPRGDQNVSFLTELLRHADLNRMVYGSGQPLVTGTMLKRLEIPDLRFADQSGVAAALNNANRLIAALERLIHKKQSIKQGMMQQLFTGKTRLPGFTEPWRQTRLRESGTTYGGLTGKTKDDFGRGSATFVTFMEVMQGARLRGQCLERVRVRPFEHQNSVQRGDLLFNGSSETPEEVALSAVVDFDASPTTYLNSFCFGYRPKRSDLIDSAYLAYFFRSSSGRALVASLAQGATRYNIAKTKLLESTFVLPALSGQHAIVEVLTDAEKEIDALNQRLAKAKSVKRGMMQELLTGRTRLPVREVAIS